MIKGLTKLQMDKFMKFLGKATVGELQSMKLGIEREIDIRDNSEVLR